MMIIEQSCLYERLLNFCCSGESQPEHKRYKLIWKLQLIVTVRRLSLQECRCLAQGHVGRGAAHLPAGATKYPDRMELLCGSACLTAGHFKTLINNYQVV